MLKIFVIALILPALFATPDRDGKIVGGTAAKSGQFPYQVAILKWKQQYCGGSILTANVFLTAAHCNVDSVSNFQIFAGLCYKNTADGQLLDMASFLPHRSFSRASSGYDVALIRTRQSLKFNSYVAPITLNTNPVDPTGTCIATGWGLTKDGDNRSGAACLQTVAMTLMSNKVCAYNHWGRLPAGTICATAPGKDTCQGDSGGPLVVNVNGQMVQVGITSYGAECAHPDLPGVYTSVGKYFAWINDNKYRV